MNELADLPSGSGATAGLRLVTTAPVRGRGDVRALFPLTPLRAPNTDGAAATAGNDNGAHAQRGDDPPPEAA